MNTPQAETTDDQRPERAVLVREFVAADLAVEGRTVDVRLVPFGEVARVADPPDYTPYREEWLPGCFDHQLNAANRIHAKYGHSESVLDVVGHGMALRSMPGDGYHISTKIHQTPQGDTTLELLRDGALPCVSLEAVAPSKWSRLVNGVVQRSKGNLRGFAFCRQGAFAGARVLAIREEFEEDEHDFAMDELLPPPPPVELLERCKRLGIKIPESMEALLERAFTESAWDGNSSRWPTAEAYCAASAIDLNPAGKPKTKSMCHLPYKEPGTGTVNVNGVRAALARIGQGFPQDASQEQRDAAKATLERLLASFKTN